MRVQIRDLVATDELETLYDLTDDELVVAAGTLLQVETELIRASIDRRIR